MRYTWDGMERYVAILEDEPGRQHAMSQVLARQMPDVRIAMFDSAPRMLEWLATNLPHVILFALDHDLPIIRDAEGQLIDHGDGMDVAKYLSTLDVTAPVVIHSSNAVAANQMVAVLRSAGWAVDRTHPRDDLRWVEEDWQPIVIRLREERWFAQAV